MAYVDRGLSPRFEFAPRLRVGAGKRCKRGAFHYSVLSAMSVTVDKIDLACHTAISGTLRGLAAFRQGGV
jgi:hypothetical protein